MDNFICAGYIFSSNFDSGNLHKVELVKWHEEALPNNEAVAVEFNLWTKPDCAGTEYENLNRSWFFFCIQGGDPNKVCKFNIVNLNKQAKLFSQGMHPVIRVGETGKWERIKYSPVYHVYDNEFILSFLHKPQTDITTKFYYAFTFPFTYTDCQNQLARFDTLYLKSTEEMNYILRRLNVEVDAEVDVNCNTINFQSNDSEGVENQRNHSNVESVSSLNRASTSSIGVLENQSDEEIENDIYYHRELLINSIEGRRVDLLTITSFHNIQNEYEYRFPELFPDSHSKRCKTFRNKKIIFISSRVHPGETPASFILNGFLKMILDRKNRYATVLRKMYVFKIIPLLNPDGVYNGHYRSDVLGHNLNRVYLAPKRETQPSIYAVRKLIRYYHNENDIDDEEPTIVVDTPIMTTTTTTVNNTQNSIEEPDIILANNNSEPNSIVDVTTLHLDIPEQTSSELEETDVETTDEKSRVNVLSEINIEAKNNRNVEKMLDIVPMTSTSTTSISLGQSSTIETEFEPKPSCSTESTSVSSSTEESTSPHSIVLKKRKNGAKLKTALINHNNNKNNNNNKFTVKLPISSLPKIRSTDASTSNDGIGIKVKKLTLRVSPMSNQNSYTPNSLSSRDSCSDNSGRSSSSTFDSTRNEKKKELTHGINANTGNSSNRLNRKQTRNESEMVTTTSSSVCNSKRISSMQSKHSHPITSTNINISADFRKDSTQRSCDEQSNMFLYIDLHGHASKKGVFMYGNYLPNIAESVECMLLPRLMSLNSHHFHFDACVFSERNMYHKGKRDGLSKEGSGRVAIYKTIGLVKSYTLEGNYNTGKYVNILPMREKEIHQRKICTIPPKYTPTVFEEVGRALGPSILDLTDSNPSSRLRMSQFRSLQGLRNALRNDIERGLLRADPIQKANATHPKLKTLKTSTACSSPLTADVCKENKGTTNKSSTISYGKKEKSSTVSLGRKKGKVLCDVIASTSTAPPIPTKRQKVVVNTNNANNNSSSSSSGSSGSSSSSSSISNNNASSGTSGNNNSKKYGTGDKPDSKESTFDLDINAMNNLNLKSDDVTVITPNATITDPDDLSAFIDQPATSFDPDIPCCSYQMLPQSTSSFNPFKYPNAPKKSGNFLRKTTASTSSMLINPSTIVVQNSKVKSSAIKLRSSYSGAGLSNNGSRLKSLRKPSVTKDGRRMKKKKSLKADTGVKRKKSKVF